MNTKRRLNNNYTHKIELESTGRYRRQFVVLLPTIVVEAPFLPVVRDEHGPTCPHCRRSRRVPLGDDGGSAAALTGPSLGTEWYTRARGGGEGACAFGAGSVATTDEARARDLDVCGGGERASRRRFGAPPTGPRLVHADAEITISSGCH